ncbi:MAG: hypothetical protein O2V44_09400 [Candidatus Bathyarchaeota archaeon]|nr:hypothetical protein [Candidatus Bathyarchaeota archaeon]
MPNKTTEILDRVKDPFSALILILLMVEGLLGGMAYAFEAQRQMLIFAIIIFLAAYSVMVYYLVVRNPISFSVAAAEQLGNDIHICLSGAFSNLEDTEAREAWATLSGVIRAEGEEHDLKVQTFREKVAARIEKNAHVQAGFLPLQNDYTERYNKKEGFEDTSETSGKEVLKLESSSNELVLDLTELGQGFKLIAYYKNHKLKHFIEIVFSELLAKKVPPNSYGKNWIIIDSETCEEIKVLDKSDVKTLSEIGISTDNIYKITLL